MEKIVELGKKRFSEAKKQKIQFVNDEHIDEQLNDIKNCSHAFVLACLMSRQIKGEKAWSIPQTIFDIYKTNNISLYWWNICLGSMAIRK
jgi:hypothetical protein